MLHLTSTQNAVLVEPVGRFEISMSFKNSHSFGDIRIYLMSSDFRKENDVTEFCFFEYGKSVVDASIENLTRAREWCLQLS